ncbi:hypothetical protein ACWD4G_06140 [Streptomyces sp. NPDC002643]
MNQVTENRSDMAATVVSLAAEATALETRADEIRRELLDLDGRIEAVTEALHRATGETGDRRR